MRRRPLDEAELNRLEELSGAAVAGLFTSSTESYADFSQSFTHIQSPEDHPRFSFPRQQLQPTTRQQQSQPTTRSTLEVEYAAALAEEVQAKPVSEEDDELIILEETPSANGGLDFSERLSLLQVDNFVAAHVDSDDDGPVELPVDSDDDIDPPLPGGVVVSVRPPPVSRRHQRQAAILPPPPPPPTQQLPPKAAPHAPPSPQQLAPEACPPSPPPPPPRACFLETAQAETTQEPLEAFSLDPDFDYDNVVCTPRLTLEEELELWKAHDRQQEPNDDDDDDDEEPTVTIEDVVKKDEEEIEDIGLF